MQLPTSQCNICCSARNRLGPTSSGTSTTPPAFQEGYEGFSLANSRSLHHHHHHHHHYHHSDHQHHNHHHRLIYYFLVFISNLSAICCNWHSPNYFHFGCLKRTDAKISWSSPIADFFRVCVHDYLTSKLVEARQSGAKKCFQKSHIIHHYMRKQKALTSFLLKVSPISKLRKKLLKQVWIKC